MFRMKHKLQCEKKIKKIIARVLFVKSSFFLQEDMADKNGNSCELRTRVRWAIRSPFTLTDTSKVN